MNTVADRIPAFVENFARIRQMHFDQMGYKFAPEPLEAQETPRYFKIWTMTSDGKRGSILCFIAKEDFTTKGLGSVRAGDVMKPAGVSTPARVARGNIFDKSNGMRRMGPYGPAYLK